MELESYDELSVFQNNSQLSPCLDKGIKLINDMIELNYIEYGSSGLHFTDDGMKYMLKKCNEYANSNKIAHNVVMDFKKDNLLVNQDITNVNRNNTTILNLTNTKVKYGKRDPGPPTS